MKVLKESKESLPTTFLTNFVSDGWEKVGIIKDQIDAIKREYSGTKKVEELLQDLVDAYLVCIGQLEQHLADKDYLDVNIEELKEDVNINIEEVKIIKPEVEVEHEHEAEEVFPEAEIEGSIEQPVEGIVCDGKSCEEKSAEDKLAEIEEACKSCEKEPEAFEYFVDDFPEPVKSSEDDDE